MDYNQLARQIKCWGRELRFAHVGICDIDLQEAGQQLREWLHHGYHGQMSWMGSYDELRWHPELLVPGTLRVISVSMPYLHKNTDYLGALSNPYRAYISRYALGRDYHKTLRKRLKQLGEKIKTHCANFNYRPFVDSAPLL